MTSTEKYLEALGGKWHLAGSGVPDSELYITAAYKLAAGEKEDKESLLFSALTKFMMKSALSSMAEIER